MKNIIYTMLTIITLSFITTNANAVSVLGLHQCGKWVNAKEQSKTYSASYEQQKSWLGGFMSGLVVAYDKDLLKDANSASIVLWVDNYCSANPLDSLPDAGLELFEVLKNRKGLK